MTHKQTQALAALLTQPTKEKAARAAGIGLTTLKRYLADPEFQEEYQKAVADLIEDAATAAKPKSCSFLPAGDRNAQGRYRCKSNRGVQKSDRIQPKVDRDIRYSEED